MKHYDIVAIGELNVDIILNRIEKLPEIGKEIFAQDMTVTLGSSTAIFAANAAALGAKVAFVGMIGKDAFGAQVRSQLADKGVDVSMLIEHPTMSTGATIVLNYGEDRANVTFQGAMDVMNIEDINMDVFGKTKHIHISSVFMQSGLKRDLQQILELAQRSGATTSLDTQWDPREEWEFDYQTLLPLITVFLPNETELKLLTKSESLEEAVEKIKPYINVCMIKQGARGSLLLTKEGLCHQQAAYLNTNAVDAIGAGDSFNSGFISRFVQGMDICACQDFGNLTGALNTTASGGTAAFASKEKLVEVAKKQFNKEIIGL